jgi:hypothetical protein
MAPQISSQNTVCGAIYPLLQTILLRQRESPIMTAMTNVSNLALPPEVILVPDVMATPSILHIS